MRPCPLPAPGDFRSPGPRSWPLHAANRAVLLAAALAALALLACPAQAQPPHGDEPETEATRAVSPGPLRTILVKALGQGATPQEAEEEALKAARTLAAQHLHALGGQQALDASSETQRVVTLRHFPQLGFGPARAVVLLELRLRGQAEPLPATKRLPVLRASASADLLTLEASLPCEAVAALTAGKGAEPLLLPGGVQTFRLRPGKPVRQALPHATGQTLHVLACTGGLSVPPNPASLEEAFTKARAGRPHPSKVQGVVSDCVEQRVEMGR